MLFCLSNENKLFYSDQDVLSQNKAESLICFLLFKNVCAVVHSRVENYWFIIYELWRLKKAIEKEISTSTLNCFLHDKYSLYLEKYFQ